MRWLRGLLYLLIQCTWGAPQTLLGLIVFVVNLFDRRSRRFCFHGAVITKTASLSSVSLGLFVFVSSRPQHFVEDGVELVGEGAFRALLVHEYGHTIQSLVLGPLYLPLIGIASMLWAALPVCKRKRRNGTPYAAFPTESSANKLGERISGERSFRNALHL